MRTLTLALIVLLLPPGCVSRPMRPGTITYIRVVQSENPAGPGTIVIEPSGTTATVPATYKPPDAPKAPTPAQNALGGLVWLGGALIVLGGLGVALRFLPWTAAFGAVIPIGASVMVALGGGLLIAFATVLARSPWWVIWLGVAGVVVIGLIVAMRDNWKLLKKAA